MAPPLPKRAQPVHQQHQPWQESNHFLAHAVPSTGPSRARIPALGTHPTAFFPDDPDLPGTGPEDEDGTWLVIVVLALALVITIASGIRSCSQQNWFTGAGGGWTLLGQDQDSQGFGGQGGPHGSHGQGQHSSHGHQGRYGGSGPHHLPQEDEDEDADQSNPDTNERLALLTDVQRQAYDAARAFQAAHPPGSVPTDISLSQYLSIQEKGVSAWEFEALFDDHRRGVNVHDRTELTFQGQDGSVQTNLPLPKQQEVYYWEVKMFEKSADALVSVGVSTKPYPLSRLPGYNRHSIGYFSKDGQKYCNSPWSGHPYGPIYFEGDVVGCGYRPRTGTLFYTRNGKRLEDAYTGGFLGHHNLFPTVGVMGGPCVLHVNFGQSGFVFVEANVKKWGLAPASGSLAPPPAYGSERGSILLEAGTGMANAVGGMRLPAPPTRRPHLQSSQSRARIQAAEVLVQMGEHGAAHSSGNGGTAIAAGGGGGMGGASGGVADYGRSSPVHISMANMSAPPPQYTAFEEGYDQPGALGGSLGNSRRKSQRRSRDQSKRTSGRILDLVTGRSSLEEEEGSASQEDESTTTALMRGETTSPEMFGPTRRGGNGAGGGGGGGRGRSGTVNSIISGLAGVVSSTVQGISGASGSGSGSGSGN